MKKVYFLLLAFTFSSSHIYAQYVVSKDASVKWGDEYKPEGGKKSYVMGIIGHDQNGFVALRNNDKGKYFLERHTMSLKHKASKEIEMSYKGKDMAYESTIFMNGKTYLFSSYMNMSDKIMYLFSQEIDLKSLQKKGTLKKLAQVSFKSRRNQGNFSFRLSRDTSKVLIYYKLPYEKNTEEKFGFHVFDKDLNEMWSKEVTLPYEDQMFFRYSIKVSDQGKVFILGRLKHEKGSLIKKGVPNFSYKILVYEQGGNVKKFDIKLDDYIIGDMTISVDDVGNIVCAGFYSTRSLSGLKGVFYMRIDGATQKIIKQSYKDLSFEFMTEGMTEKQETKANKIAAKGKGIELNRFTFDELILRSDGGAVLVGERYYERTHTYKSGNNTYTYYTYHYEDMVVISVSPQGELSWTTKVQKKQSSRSPGPYMGYTTFVQDSDIYLMFNDNAKNYQADNKQGQVYGFSLKKEDQVVSLVKIDGGGNDKRQALFRRSDSEIFLYPRYSQRIDNNRILIYGEKSKIAKFGMMTFSY